MNLGEKILQLPAVDQHAHNMRKATAQVPFEAAFSESYDNDVWENQTPETIFYKRSLRQLSKLWGCGSSGQEVKAYREGRTPEELTKELITASNLSFLLLDDGLNPDEIQPWTWHEQFVPTRRVLRLEQLAEELIEQCEDLTQVERAFSETLRSTGREVVGFKSIAAYRGGLNVKPATRESAELDMLEYHGRLSHSPLYSHLLYLALEIASARDLPVQFHTGFGDPDLRLDEGNPILLTDLIERFTCPFVLLHAGYPYTREAGFLASVYPNVWVDFGLTIPFLSTAGMRKCLSELFELSPLNRLMYSSDASLIPELYYLGSLNSRLALNSVLEECKNNNDLTDDEAVVVAEMLLSKNALNLYELS